jgi:uncharacterized Tic20 family protein
MRVTKSLLVVAAVTLLDLAWKAIMATASEQIATDGWSLIGFGLFTLLLAALTPVFFAALYWDAGHVRESGADWTPDRRLWVGGGVAVWLAVYAASSSSAVGYLGVAYLVQRLRHPAPERVEPDDERTQSGDRSLAGVAVHLLALPTSALGAGLVYATSDDDFTRANARHALNWHLPLLALTLAGYALAVASADSGSGILFETFGAVIPAPASTVTFLLGVVMLLAAVAAWHLTVLLAVVAAIKAVLGAAWSYPFAFEFVSRDA